MQAKQPLPTMKRVYFISFLLLFLPSDYLRAYDQAYAYWATNLPSFTSVTYWTGQVDNNGHEFGNWSNGVPSFDNYAIVTVQENNNYPVFSYEGYIGYLHIQNGAKVFADYGLFVQHGLVLESDHQSTGKLILSQQYTANPQAVFTTPRIILRREFPPNEWTFFSVPATVNEFNIWIRETEEYYPPVWGDLETPHVLHNMYVARYNGKKRYETGLSNPVSGLNWEQLTSVTVQTPEGTVQARQLVSNEGYIIFNPSTYNTTTMLFVVDSIALINKLIATNFSTDFEQSSYWNPAASVSNPNANWNFKGAPFFGNYNLAYSYQQAGEPMFFYQFDRQTGTYNVLDNTVDSNISAAGPLFYQSAGPVLTREARSMYCTLTYPGCSPVSVKTVSEDNDVELVLELSNTKKADRTRIRFSSSASEGYIVNEDAIKLMSHIHEVPQLWSVEKGIRLAVNNLPFSGRQTVTLGIRLNQAATGSPAGLPGSAGLKQQPTDSAGQYQLKLINREQLSMLKQLILYDKITGSRFNLLETDYTIPTDGAQFSDNRFEIVAENQLYTGCNAKDALQWQVIVDRGVFYLDGLSEAIDVSVYNSTGQQVFSCKNLKNHQPIQLKSGIFLLKAASQLVKLVL